MGRIIVRMRLRSSSSLARASYLKSRALQLTHKINLFERFWRYRPAPTNTDRRSFHTDVLARSVPMVSTSGVGSCDAMRVKLRCVVTALILVWVLVTLICLFPPSFFLQAEEEVVR